MLKVFVYTGFPRLFPNLKKAWHPDFRTPKTPPSGKPNESIRKVLEKLNKSWH
jgi:hypothetical protein